eukprot:CAMPEP_0183367526 /NCGR_PEP_ID=MMETSP0164_2-20130417/92805_1 /TAXON_ID=221442 /ORGANISM="Coccolithus pelagicus ssp braarudi, Strain PLY182g" /LENGTH=71 /DNA_ID=CAMNT_0025543473 /DNA_START=143 /DNA_END=355 /DNA_ORIENTATION=+
MTRSLRDTWAPRGTCFDSSSPLSGSNVRQQDTNGGIPSGTGGSGASRRDGATGTAEVSVDDATPATALGAG